MGWLIGSTSAIERVIEAMTAELAASRADRAELLRAMADERGRSDRITNALLEAKGAEPIPPSPGPPLMDSGDLFAEDPVQLQDIRTRIHEHGLGAVVNG